MNSQYQTLLHKITGYYAIPHELLHVLAYRLIGKPYQYQWGDHSVRPLTERTKGERLFISLLPFVVCVGMGLFCQVLWVLSAFFIQTPPEHYFTDGLTWHIILPIIGSVFILYSGAAHGDLINSYHLLFGQNKSQDTRPKPHRDSKKQ